MEPVGLVPQVWRTLSQSFSLPGPLGMLLLAIGYLWYVLLW